MRVTRLICSSGYSPTPILRLVAVHGCIVGKYVWLTEPLVHGWDVCFGPQMDQLCCSSIFNSSTMIFWYTASVCRELHIYDRLIDGCWVMTTRSLSEGTHSAKCLKITFPSLAFVHLILSVIMNGTLTADQMACCLCLQCPDMLFQLTSI